jgi:hypothetical protein
MTDLVERIRFMRYRGRDEYLNQKRDILDEAAAEIERLRALLKEGLSAAHMDDWKQRVAAALEPKP